MQPNTDNVILTFPPRPVSQWERALLAEWFAATRQQGLGISHVYVSERRGDDPMIVGRIVIVEQPSKAPTHVIYSPTGSTFWVVASPRSLGDLLRVRTLRAALNSIRPVFEDQDEAPTAATAGNLAW